MTTATPTIRPRATPAKPKLAPRWSVILLDDDDHTYDYVIRMMQEVFGHDLQQAYGIAKMVDTEGRAVCLVTHLEHAELKLEQIEAFGADPVLERCAGSMSAMIEPVE